MVNDRNKAIFRSIAEVIGGRPVVYRAVSDHFPDLTADILYAAEWPVPGAHLAATVDLSDGDMGYELFLRAREAWDVERVLGDVGIRVRRDMFTPRPGATVMHGMMPTYDDLAVRHMLALPAADLSLPFVPPQVEPPVAFLELVPLTDAELAWVESAGHAPFIAASATVDLLDFGREGIEPRV